MTSRFDGGDVTSGDIKIDVILSDSIFSHNGRHFVITVDIFQHSGNDVIYVTSHPMTSQITPFCEILFLIKIFAILSDTIF